MSKAIGGKVVGAARFKANCLAILDQVRATGEPVTVTKRGAPVAVLGPLPDAPGADRRSPIGFLKDDRYRFERAPEAPAGDPEEWAALR